MIALVVLNDPPYGTERSHHGLRLAQAMARADDTRVQVFLLGDAVACAKAGQRTPDGWYDTSRMLGGLMAAERRSVRPPPALMRAGLPRPSS